MSTIDSETLHRLVKEALDSGAANSLEEAEQLFAGYRLGFVLDDGEASSPTHQAALLSGVALARRVFLGGALVVGQLDVPLRVPLPLGRTVAEAVVALGGLPVQALPTGTPAVRVGGKAQPKLSPFEIRTTFCGWSGGIVPGDTDADLSGERLAMPLAPLLSAALAVNEAFLHVRREGAMAGRRSVGFSLWRPQFGQPWPTGQDGGPDVHFLPAHLWLIGLGHLGQAYLWALGLLPYPTPSKLQLILQDVDIITHSTESTSILSDTSVLGRKKTRAMADWCERRGFSANIHERLFDAHFQLQDSEPSAALCGLDNALGRRALDAPGFSYVVEAGLGSGYQDFRTLRVHTLPGARSAQELWREGTALESSAARRPAYERLLRDGMDQCGVTTLAGKAVGAPFVGAVAACLAVADLLRLLHGGPQYEVLDLDLMNIEYAVVVPRARELGPLNPGYVTAGVSTL